MLFGTDFTDDTVFSDRIYRINCFCCCNRHRRNGGRWQVCKVIHVPSNHVMGVDLGVKSLIDLPLTLPNLSTITSTPQMEATSDSWYSSAP